MPKRIEVLDYIMGAGKTKYIFEYISDHPEKRFIYVTPLLSEAESRAVSSCASVEMTCPTTEDGTKKEHVLELLREGRNISTTHSLFRQLRKEHISLLSYWKYTIIIDETIDFIESFVDYTQDDIKDLVNKEMLTFKEDEQGKASFEWDVSPNNHFRTLHDLCEAGSVYSTKAPNTMLNVQIPPSVLEAAEAVIVCTYLYEHSLMNAFMSLHGFEHTYIKVDKLEEESKVIHKRIKNNLKLVSLQAADKYLERAQKTALSHSWWQSAMSNGRVLDLFKMCSTWLSNNKEHCTKFFFTCPKSIVTYDSSVYKRRVKPAIEKESIKYFNDVLGTEVQSEIVDDVGNIIRTETMIENVKWLFSGTKATNDFSDKTMCFYLMNTYPNLAVQHYLSDYGHKIDQDMYALSEMIQFLWRGNIRKPDGSMKVYVASKRMKQLLIEWINSLE